MMTTKLYLSLFILFVVYFIVHVKGKSIVDTNSAQLEKGERDIDIDAPRKGDASLAGLIKDVEMNKFRHVNNHEDGEHDEDEDEDEDDDEDENYDDEEEHEDDENDDEDDDDDEDDEDENYDD